MHNGVFPVDAPPGVTLSEICADDIGAHVFRHQVAAELDSSPDPWPARARALRSCGEAGAGLRCKDCQEVHVVPHRCAARSCPTCAHIASALAVDRVFRRAERGAAQMVDVWDGVGKPQKRAWKLLTCTTQAFGKSGDASRFQVPVLSPGIRRVRGAWGPFWRSLPWGAQVAVIRDRVDKATGEVTGTRRSKVMRRDVMFAMGVEVAPGGMIHLHAAVYGEYIGWRELLATWHGAFGADGNIKIQAMRADTAEDFRKGLREVLKYVSKGDKSPRRVEWAANIERSMKNVRRVEMGGALRVKVTDEELSRAVIYAGAKSCEGCGSQTPRWQWAGLRASEYVVRNGGFGKDNLHRMQRELKRFAVMKEETRHELAEYYAGDDAVFPVTGD